MLPKLIRWATTGENRREKNIFEGILWKLPLKMDFCGLETYYYWTITFLKTDIYPIYVDSGSRKNFNILKNFNLQRKHSFSSRAGTRFQERTSCASSERLQNANNWNSLINDVNFQHFISQNEKRAVARFQRWSSIRPRCRARIRCG